MAETLLERAGELQELREALVAAGEGTGGVVVVEGPAGIGKTASWRRPGLFDGYHYRRSDRRDQRASTITCAVSSR